jgi:hypothetical protein
VLYHLFCRFSRCIFCPPVLMREQSTRSSLQFGRANSWTRAG